MKIFGIDINVSNLFEGQIQPYSFLFAIESWVHIHAWLLLMMYVRFFSFKYGWWIVEAIGYFWETLEAIVFTGLKQVMIWRPDLFPEFFVSFFGENSGDGQIGDPIQDTIANSFGWYIVRKKMKSPFLMRNGLWSERTFRQRIVSVLQFFLLALACIPSVVYVVPTGVPVKGNKISAIPFGSYVPLGWWCYGILTTIVLWCMRRTDMQLFAWKGYGRDIMELYDYVFMYFLGSFFAASFFWVSTYFPLWIFYPFFFIFINMLPQRPFDCHIYIEPCSKEWIIRSDSDDINQKETSVWIQEDSDEMTYSNMKKMPLMENHSSRYNNNNNNNYYYK